MNCRFSLLFLTSMAKREQILRIKLVEDLLRRKTSASFAEIKFFLEDKFEEKELELSFTERTFQRDKKLMSEVFGKEIKYRKSQNVYYLEDSLEEDIFDNILLVEAYRETEGNANIMFFEKRKSLGLHNLHDLVQAISQQKLVKFEYRKFSEDKAVVKTLEPYALKEFRNRWYLLGNEKGSKEFFMKTYGLDRIRGLEVLNTNFEKVDFDIDAVFKNSFGIISTLDKAPEEIILSMTAEQGNFLKTLPIHHSQKIIKDTADEVRISLKLFPTYDFIQEMLSLAGLVKVLEPKSLRERLNAILKVEF